MQLDVLNDLAKAKRRWTEKKAQIVEELCVGKIGFLKQPFEQEQPLWS